MTHKEDVQQLSSLGPSAPTCSFSLAPPILHTNVDHKSPQLSTVFCLLSMNLHDSTTCSKYLDVDLKPFMTGYLDISRVASCIQSFPPRCFETPQWTKFAFSPGLTLCAVVLETFGSSPTYVSRHHATFFKQTLKTRLSINTHMNQGEYTSSISLRNTEL